MNYAEIFEAEHQIRLRIKEVRALDRDIQGTLVWSMIEIPYMGG